MSDSTSYPWNSSLAVHSLHPADSLSLPLSILFVPILSLIMRRCTILSFILHFQQWNNASRALSNLLLLAPGDKADRALFVLCIRLASKFRRFSSKFSRTGLHSFVLVTCTRFSFFSPDTNLIFSYASFLPRIISLALQPRPSTGLGNNFTADRTVNAPLEGQDSFHGVRI